MKKKKLIQEIIGSKLVEHGFIYINDSGLHIYQREKNKIKQEIIVCQHRFFKDEVKLILETNAFGQKPREICDIMPGIKREFWMYKDETEYKQILTYFRDVILSDGLGYLDKMSIPTSDAVTNPEIEQYLYDHHKELANEYRQKLSLQNATDEQVLETIKLFLRNTSEKEFKEVKEDLIGLAAVYGELFALNGDSEWILNEKFHSCKIDIKYGILGLRPANTMINTWRDKDYDWLEGEHNRIMSSYHDYKSNLEMELFLYEHRVELANEYRQKLSIQNTTNDNILKSIKLFLIEISENDLEEVINELAGLSAVYGDLFVKGDDSEWVWSEQNHTCWLYIWKDKKQGLSPVNTIMNAWKYKNYNQLESEYCRVIQKYNDSKLSLEMEQYLFDHHEELAKEYSQKLSLQDMTDKAILEVIIQFLTERNEMDPKEIKHDLLGIAAVYGGLFMKGNEWRWKWNKKYDFCIIFMWKGMKEGITPLYSIIEAWKIKDYKYLRGHYQKAMINYSNYKSDLIN